MGVILLHPQLGGNDYTYLILTTGVGWWVQFSWHQVDRGKNASYNVQKIPCPQQKKRCLQNGNSAQAGTLSCFHVFSILFSFACLVPVAVGAMGSLVFLLTKGVNCDLLYEVACQQKQHC